MSPIDLGHFRSTHHPIPLGDYPRTARDGSYLVIALAVLLFGVFIATTNGFQRAERAYQMEKV